MLSDQIKQFFNPAFTYAVIGATTDRAKYGYTVLKDLAAAEYSVVGVNPKYTEIDSITVYPDLNHIPIKPDVAVFVIPPEIGLTLLDQCARLGIERVWFQPGAESQAIRERISTLNLIGQADGACIMVVRRTINAHA